jgi:hypothetical protein
MAQPTEAITQTKEDVALRPQVETIAERFERDFEREFKDYILRRLQREAKEEEKHNRLREPQGEEKQQQQHTEPQQQPHVETRTTLTIRLSTGALVTITMPPEPVEARTAIFGLIDENAALKEENIRLNDELMDHYYTNNDFLYHVARYAEEKENARLKDEIKDPNAAE